MFRPRSKGFWAESGTTHLLDDDVSSIKKSAIWIRRPRKCKVVEAVLLPQIWQLAARAVDNECDLVELDEFGILRCLGISNEQAILYLCRHVVAQEYQQPSPQELRLRHLTAKSWFRQCILDLSCQIENGSGCSSSPHTQHLQFANERRIHELWWVPLVFQPTTLGNQSWLYVLRSITVKQSSISNLVTSATLRRFFGEFLARTRRKE